MVKIKGRILKALLYLLECDYPVSLKKVSEDTGININTLRKDVQSISDFLKNYELSIVARPNVGIKIEGSNEKKKILKEELRITEDIFNSTENKIWLASYLLLASKRTPTIEELSDILDKSRPTINAYIKKIREWLKDFNIILIGEPGRGYVIKGEEYDIRSAIKSSIKNILSYNFDNIAIKFSSHNDSQAFGQNIFGVRILKTSYFPTIKKFVEGVLSDLKVVINPQDMFSFALDIYITLERILRGFRIVCEDETSKTIENTKEYGAISRNLKILENNLKIELDNSEIIFLTKKFLSIRAESFENIPSESIPEIYLKKVGEIIDFAESSLGFVIERDPELMKMFAMHLKGAVEKIKLGVNIENPLLRTIKREYTFAFGIAKKVSENLFRSFRVAIPEEEIGYIATYIMALLESAKLPRKIKTIVICPMGIATSKILYYRLIQEFPNLDIVETFSFKETLDNKIPSDVDLIISTTHINFNLSNIPTIVVSPLLMREDVKIIRERIKEITKSKISDSRDNLNDKFVVYIKDSFKNKEELVKTIGKELIDKGYVKNGFVEAVLEREKKFPTGIESPIPFAIPHAESEYTLKSVIVIVLLKKPLLFNLTSDKNKSVPVSIVVLPAISNKEEDGKMLYKVIEKLNKPDIAKEILESNQSDKILRLLTSD
ncbi:MAG: BglG family transcription antiterminator [Caldisericum sp.]|uniref:BglG family transcription antiterminator n=1 Tax=Caldisericum sp. TaxID=2499687 RepID=UPI003D0A22E3